MDILLTVFELTVTPSPELRTLQGSIALLLYWALNTVELRVTNGLVDEFIRTSNDDEEEEEIVEL